MSGRINDYYYLTLDNETFKEMEEPRKYVNEDVRSKIDTVEQFIAYIFGWGGLDWLMPEKDQEKFPKLKDFATYPDENVRIFHNLIEDNANLEIVVNGKVFCDKTIKEIERSSIDEGKDEKFIKSIKIPDRWGTYDEPYSEDHIGRISSETERSEYGFLIANDQLFYSEDDEEYIYQDLEQGMIKVLVDNENKNACRTGFVTEKFDPSKLIFVSRGDVEEHRNNPGADLFCIYIIYDGEELDIEGDPTSKDINVKLGEDAWPMY
jgi:hypothetical protein